MFTFSLLFVIAFAAVNCQQQYVPQQYVGPIGQVSQQQSHSDASASAQASSHSSSSGNAITGLTGQVGVPSPYTVMDPRAQTSYATESFHPNKGEILIHRPAPIIVKRPPTRVLVNHPPLVVKPAPVVLHKPPPVVLRKVYVKQHPRPVKVEPVYVNVVKPPAEKYYVNEKAQAAVGYNTVGSQYHSHAQSQAQAQAQAQSQSQGQVHY